MKNRFQKINFIFLLSFVTYIPFQGLLQNFLEFNSSLSTSLIFWLSHWYEPILLLFLILSLGSIRKFKNIRISQKLTGLLILLGIFSILFLSKSIGRGLEGFRFTLLGLIIYLWTSLQNIDHKLVKKLVNTYLVVAGLIALWALIERALPHYYWSGWHVIDPKTVFGYGWHNVAFVKQSASVIGGPNQLATYLLPAFFISISRMVGHSKDLSKKTSFLYLVLSILFNLVIFLTFSRSAILALLILLVVAAVSMLRNKWLKNYVITLVVALTLILVVVFSLKENSIEIITHGRSQSEHATAMSVSLLEISSRLHHPVSLLFGAGLGTAGPLALKYGEGIISESWYLQLALELGIAGLILWLAFIASILKELFKKYEFGLFFALISVSIAAMFLHTFADNLALTYTLFILIGLLLNNKTYEKNFN